MTNICLYFQIHQPFRLNNYSLFDIGKNHNYFDESKNKEIFKKVASKCYIPAGKILLDLIKEHDNFKVSFSISGTALEQMEKYSPEVLEIFKKLAKTNKVEFLAETYNHSLAFLYSEKEFEEQVKLHSKKIKNLFDVEPKIFRNTELIYNNSIAKKAETLGFKGILAEGPDHLLGWRSPNFVYKCTGTNKIKVLLKNYKLSDDIAFRFSNKEWKEYPLNAKKFSSWIKDIDDDIINLFMDFETFGEHQWEETGIFKFLREFPKELIKNNTQFLKISDALKIEPKGDFDVKEFISWADIERDLSAWLGNKMQKEAIKELYLIEEKIKEKKDPELLQDWRNLQTSDHFYYMCTKWFADGDVHKYFNPYNTPYEAFTTFMHVFNDLLERINYEKILEKEIISK